MKLYTPALVTLFVMIVIAGWFIYSSGGDPLALAQIGTRFSVGDPAGTEGYDGQFCYYIARNPNPNDVKKYLDVPAYRYQRILWPLLVRMISFGNESLIPWVFPILNILLQSLGTLLLSILLSTWNINPWYALPYGIWAGFSLAIRLDLPEALAYALVISALLAYEKKHEFIGSVFFGLALFAKDVTILFLGAALIAMVFQKKWLLLLQLLIISLMPYIIFQLWLRMIFGSFGIGSGGLMATPFEILPLMGFFRIGYYSLLYMLMMLIVFLPSVIGPAMWGVWTSIKKLTSSNYDVVTISLLVNSLVIFFLPFSTFRETGGLLRMSCGLILAVILFVAQNRQKRLLKFTYLWIVYNAFLLK
jgi:hypothetical protein